MKLFRKKVDEKISQTEFLEFLDMWSYPFLCFLSADCCYILDDIIAA